MFFDLLPYRGLQGCCALPLLVMHAPQHALAVDVHLRPLLVELGATVPTPGLAVLESDLSQIDAALCSWAEGVAQALGRRIPPESALADAQLAAQAPVDQSDAGADGNPLVRV